MSRCLTVAFWWTSVSTHPEAPDYEIEAAVAAIRTSQTMVALAVTGGGSGIIPHLLARPGASRTVLEAQVPYAPNALTDLLGVTAESSCSPETARAMAASVYERAQRLRESLATPVVGLGAAAALTTDRERRGSNAIYVAAVDGFQVWESSMRFRKGGRTRGGEESIAELAILATLTEAMGVGVSVNPPLESDDHWTMDRYELGHPRDVLERTEQPWATVDRSGVARAGGPVPGAVVSGSFNPHHAGHAALLEAARRRTDRPVAYEISVTNVDKPPLSASELGVRLAQFRDLEPVVLTCAPTFIEKARLLPGCAFVVGLDTASRILEPRYYGGADNFERVLAEFRDLRVRFHVGGRLMDGRFQQLEDLSVKESVADLFDQIPACEARVDISSSQLRGPRNV